MRWTISSAATRLAALAFLIAACSAPGTIQSTHRAIPWRQDMAPGEFG